MFFLLYVIYMKKYRLRGLCTPSSMEDQLRDHN
nr:MAG TPA: hypothetical protein [Caudoviricetes sp.]